MRTLFLLILIFLVAPAAAQERAQSAHARVELFAESAAPASGADATLAIRITPQRNWHTYWKNPGAAGVETRADWDLPPGLRADDLRYPVPSRLLVSGIMNYVYARPSTLLADVHVPPGLAAGTALPVRLRLDYLICSDTLCVPETAELERNLVIGSGARDPAVGEIFDHARAALPKPVDWPARFEHGGKRLQLAVTVPRAADVGDAYFFPSADGDLDYAAPQTVSMAGDTLLIQTQAYDKNFRVLPGVLKITYKDGRSFGGAIEAIPGAVPEAGVPRAEFAAPGALLALALAVLGGILLNFMPCVFPILGLKALSLARAGIAPAGARAEALAYAAGVMLTALALGALVLALRAAGDEVGWAFQLQNPRVILALLLLMTAIALNLAGLFDVAAPRGVGASLAERPGRAGAFWTGVLAAVVATPCTGPFMGAALGAAVLLPPLTGLVVFAGLGLGLALPFLAIGYVPALRKRLPRPGPWLLGFRRVLAVPMFAAALALAWVLGRQTGTGGLMLGVAAALALGLALWWLGLRQRGGRRGAFPLALAAGAVLAAVVVPPRAKPEEARQVAALPGSLPFSPTRLAALRAEGRPVFLYFTADWCITCKVNEEGALASAEVRGAFAHAGVTTMVGDWTDADAEITRFLEAHGRAGVPLYLFYGADGSVTVLPQILTPGRLVALVAAKA